MKVAHIVIMAVSGAFVSACTFFMPVNENTSRKVSQDYTVIGPDKDIRAYVYGNHTIIQFDKSPTFFSVMDETGASVPYKEVGQYYRLARHLNNFTVLMNGRSMIFSAITNTNALSVSTSAPIGVVPVKKQALVTLKSPQGNQTNIDVAELPVLSEKQLESKRQANEILDKSSSAVKIAKGIPAEESQKSSPKEIVQGATISRTDMTSTQEQAQTIAAIVSAQGNGMKMDNVFASAKRIVPFSFSANGLGPIGKQVVKEMALVAKDAHRVYVRGRTDSSGTKEKNAILAKSRADSVRTMLAANGIPRSKMRATYCTTCYVAANDTENGRRLNRRVDIELIMPTSKVAALPKGEYEIVQLDTSPALGLQKDMQIAGQ